MGRRRSHHRVDDRGDDWKLVNRMSEGKLSKPKQASNDEGGESEGEVHQRSKVIKRGDKRKRDNNNIVSRKRHAQRPKSKYPYGSSKMSSKQKTKQFSRWKSFSGSDSGLSGGKSSDSSMHLSNSTCHSDCDDSDDSGCSSSSREQSRKRSRVHHFEEGQIIETVNKDHRKRVSRSKRRDELMCNSRSKLLLEDEHESHQHGNIAEITSEELIQGSACFEGVTTFGVEGRHSKFMDERVQVCISKALEQENGQPIINLAGEEAGLDDGAIKAKILEIELRQKALANLMRHRDATCRRNNQKEISNSSVPIIEDGEKGDDIVEEFTASANQHSNIHEEEEAKVSAPEISDLPGLVSVIGVVDSNIDENRWPLTSDITPQRTYSLEPKKDVAEDSTSGSHMAPKLVPVGDLETVRKSNFEVEKVSRGSDLLWLEVTDNSHKNSLLPLENEAQLETKLELRTTSETSGNRDFCKKVTVSREETKSGMANCFSELAKAGASQAEAKRDLTISEFISTNDVEHSENEVLPCEKLHINLELENKGSNDKIEPSEDRESPVDTGLSRDENIADTNTLYIAATSMRGKSPNEIESLDPLKDCGRESAQAAPKPEIAPQKQEDGTSMFQRKTMSVMRGGELVQVNYKVYIPKRAAELAKRRLQR